MSSCNNVDRIVDRRCLEGLYLPGTLASSRHRVEQTNQKAGKQTAETAVTATEPYQDRYTEKIMRSLGNFVEIIL